MAVNVAQPFIHVENSSGLPYVGAKLYVYAVGTVTPLALYSDEEMTIVLTNPLTSDAAGNFQRAYIASGRYKLRAETSAAVLIWEYDDIDTGLSSGAGALAITGGGTGATTAAQARSNLGAAAQTDVDDIADDLSDLSTSLQSIVAPPQGRLTLNAAIPVISVSVIATTAFYYTPYVGNLMPIWDGVKHVARVFPELMLTLNSNHVANAIYDVFGTLDSGDVLLVTGPAWNTPTAGLGSRGVGAGTTQLERKGGLWTNAAAMVGRNGNTTYPDIEVNKATYLGSIHMDGTNGQISCLIAYGTARKFGVWNAYNRVPILLKAGLATASWTYNVATFRASNAASGASASSCQVFTGLAEEHFNLSFQQSTKLANLAGIGVSPESFIGIGFNSTSVASGITGWFGNTGDASFNPTTMSTPGARYIAPPSLGMNEITSLEKAEATALITTTLYGTEANMLLSATYMG